MARAWPFVMLPLIGLLCAASAGALDFEEATVIVHKDGVARGIVLEEDSTSVLIRTFVGDKRIPRSDILEYRTNLTAAERADILAKINPSEDLAKWQERQKALAENRGAPVETPKVAAGPSKPAGREEAGGGNVHIGESFYARPGSASLGVRQLTWEEQMLAGLDRVMTLEFVDTPLTEALDLISVLTRITIVIHPKVREANPTVSLNVKQMTAANVLKWLAKLTDTHIHVKEQALYFALEPDQEADDAERTEIMLAMTRMGVDQTLLPPEGTEITDADRMRIAMALFEKEHPKPADFPGPTVGAFPNDPDSNPTFNPFAP